MKSLDELRNQRRAGNTFQAQWRQNNVEVSSLAATVLFTVTVICFYLGESISLRSVSIRADGQFALSFRSLPRLQNANGCSRSGSREIRHTRRIVHVRLLDPLPRFTRLTSFSSFAIFGLFCNLVIMLRSIDWSVPTLAQPFQPANPLLSQGLHQHLLKSHDESLRQEPRHHLSHLDTSWISTYRELNDGTGFLDRLSDGGGLFCV